MASYSIRPSNREDECGTGSWVVVRHDRYGSRVVGIFPIRSYAHDSVANGLV